MSMSGHAYVQVLNFIIHWFKIWLLYKSDHIPESLKHFLLTAIVHGHPEILAVIDFNNLQNQPEGVQVNAHTVL